METFVGTKRLKAAPMTRGAYNDYRGWTLPADEDGEDAGYFVEYLDGGKANDDRHAGYISWSPADVFDAHYRAEIHPASAEFSPEQIGADPILRYFHYSHLPEFLQAASRPFCDLARHMVEKLPRNPERTVALRKLLEAKDAAVRTNVN